MDRLGLKEKCQQFLGKHRYAIFILLVGLVFMMLSSPDKSVSKTDNSEETFKQERNVQEELTEILNRIDGVGEVRVMLTVAVGEETIYQTDTETTGDSYRIDTVIVTNENRVESGLVQKINPPQYLGAIIVCKGGGNAAVKLSVVEAVSRVTGLGANQISVLKMK